MSGQLPTDLHYLLQRIVETQDGLQQSISLLTSLQEGRDSSLAAEFERQHDVSRNPFLGEVENIRRFDDNCLAAYRADKKKAWEALKAEFEVAAKNCMITPAMALELQYLFEGEEERYRRAAAVLRLPAQNAMKHHNVRVARKADPSEAFLRSQGEAIVANPFPFFPPWETFNALNRKMLDDVFPNAVTGGSVGAYPSVFKKEKDLTLRRVEGGAFVPVGVNVPLEEIEAACNSLQKEIRGRKNINTNNNTHSANHYSKNNNKKKSGGEGPQQQQPPPYQLSNSAAPFVPAQVTSSSPLPPTAPRPAPPRADF